MFAPVVGLKRSVAPASVSSMGVRTFSIRVLGVLGCALAGVLASRALAPPNVVQDLERLLHDSELLGAVASARIEEVLRSFEDPAWGGNLNHEIYDGLPISEATKYWLAGPGARNSDEVMPVVVVPLHQIQEAVNKAGARAALSEVARNVVAADLADGLLMQLEGDDARLRDVVRANRGVRGPPVAALALQRLEGSPGYFRAILREVDVLTDPWTSAAAAEKLSQEWRREHWLPTLRLDQLLRVAQPYGPFDCSLQQEAVQELQARAPHTHWLEVVSQQESDLLVEYLSDWLSEPAVIRLPPVELLQEVALQVILEEREETEWLHELLLRRAVDNSVLGRAVLSRNPEKLGATEAVASIVGEVAADSEFFLELLKQWDVFEQGVLVVAALERIRGRPEVGKWLAALREDELEHVAANEEGLYSAWMARAAHERMQVIRPEQPR